MWPRAQCGRRGCLPRGAAAQAGLALVLQGLRRTQEVGSGKWGVRGRLGEEYVDEMPITPVLGGALVSPQGL